jgi:hypothetical protein
MHESANVRSIDAIRDFRVALAKFCEQGNHALAAVDIEINRTLDWLGHDQFKFWKEEIRRREDRVNEAKIDLHRCQLSKNAAGETPACSDQKRLADAEEKLENVRRWLHIIEHEVSEYRPPSQQLASTIDSTLPRALSMLERKLASLEAYLGTVAPQQAAPEQSPLAVAPSTTADEPEPSKARARLAPGESPGADGPPQPPAPKPQPLPQ